MMLHDFNLKGETFARKKFCEVNDSQKFTDKLFRVTSNDAFHENLTLANGYFKWYHLITFRYIQANLFQFSSSWPLKIISCGINIRKYLK